MSITPMRWGLPGTGTNSWTELMIQAFIRSLTLGMADTELARKWVEIAATVQPDLRPSPSWRNAVAIAREPAAGGKVTIRVYAIGQASGGAEEAWAQNVDTF
jgi:hypothetical protein